MQTGRRVEPGPSRTMIAALSAAAAVVLALAVFLLLAATGLDPVDAVLATGLVLVAVAQLAGALGYRAQAGHTASESAIEGVMAAGPERAEHASDPATEREEAGPAAEAAEPTEPRLDGGPLGPRTVHALIAEGRGELYLEPVIDLANRRTCHYLASLGARLEDGTAVAPDRLRRSAPSGEPALAMALETVGQATAVQRHLRETGRSARIFCPVPAAMLADDGILERLQGLIDELGAREEGIVVSAIAPRPADMAGRLADRLAALARRGTGLAVEIDDDPDHDPAHLARNGIDFLMLHCDVAARLAGQPADGANTRLAAVMGAAWTLGLQTIVTGVDREETLRDIIGHPVLACGQLFAEARPVRQSLLQSRRIAAE